MHDLLPDQETELNGFNFKFRQWQWNENSPTLWTDEKGKQDTLGYSIFDCGYYIIENLSNIQQILKL